MEIITHISAPVKVSLGTIQEITQDENAVRHAETWERKKMAAKEMSLKLARLGKEFRGRSERMRVCADVVQTRICASCGTPHVVHTNLCRDRVCPVCTWRLSVKRFMTMYQIVDGLRVAYPEAPWQFVTLTVENCTPEDLTAVIDEMGRTWNNITTSAKFRKKIIGWAKSLEITYNKKTGTLHPHFHILTMWQEAEGDPDEYVIDRWLGGVHRKANRKAQNAQIIKEKVWQDQEDEELMGAVLETYKYSVKSSDLEEMPLGVFRQVLKTLAGRRLVSFGGVIKEYAKAMEADDLNDAPESDEEIEASTEKCVHCGSRQFLSVIGAWSGNGYIWRRDT